MRAESIVRNYGGEIVARRWAATSIDFLLSSIAILVPITLEKIGLLPLSIFLLLQYLILEPFTGYTIGKFVLRIKVVNESGQRIGLIKGLIRTFFRIIEVNPFLLGGIPAGIIVLSSKNKQRLGDMIANTYVIRVRDLYFFNDSYVEESDYNTLKNEMNNNNALNTIIIILATVGTIILLGVIAGVTAPNIMKYIEKSRQELSNTPVYMLDNKFSVNMPYGWNKEATNFNEDSLLSLSNQPKDLYFTILSDNKDYFEDDMDIDQYTEIIKNNLNLTIEDSRIGENTKDMNNGYYTNRFIVEGVVDKYKITYLYTIVETSDCFNQLIGWTATPSFNEDNKNDFISIANSFKEVQ